MLNGFVFVSSAGHVPPSSITWYRYHGHLTFIFAILKVKRIDNGIEVSHSHHFQWTLSYGWSCWLSTWCRTVYGNASVFEPCIKRSGFRDCRVEIVGTRGASTEVSFIIVFVIPARYAADKEADDNIANLLIIDTISAKVDRMITPQSYRQFVVTQIFYDKFSDMSDFLLVFGHKTFYLCVFGDVPNDICVGEDRITSWSIDWNGVSLYTYSGIVGG